MITTLAELVDLARRHGIDLVSEGATLDMMGLDFLVAHASDAAGTRWIIRCPRRPDVAIAAAHEARVLQTVRGKLGNVAVPEWRIHTSELIAYPHLGGTPAVTLDTGAPVWNGIDPAAPHDAFIESMAQLYAALTRITIDSATDLKTSTIEQTRSKIASAIERTHDVLEPPRALVDRWQRWLDSDTWPSRLSLVHGDLHPGHMLLDADGRLVGVLDWTEAEVADPSVDLAMFYGCFGRPALENVVTRMVAHDAVTSPSIVDHAIERWAVMPALGAAWALDHDNHELALHHARATLQSLI